MFCALSGRFIPFSSLRTYKSTASITMKLNLVPQSFVVELLQLTATGEAAECINTDVFSKAVELMRTQVIETFEDITFFLKDNECDASAVFDCFVTKETHDAFAAYLCYAI